MPDLLLCLALALAAPPPTEDQPLEDTEQLTRKERRELRKKQEADPFSELNLQRYADEIIPLTEKHAGRAFEERPTITWIDDDALSTLMEEETRELFEHVFPDVTEQFREAMAQRSRAQLGALLGKYTPANHTVHMALPRNKDGEAGIDPVRVVKLILAHELVHALQHEAQDVDDWFYRAEDEDHFQALRAVSEGQATWVERRVAEELGWLDEHHTLTEMQGWKDEELLHPAAFDVWSAYGLGMQFVRDREKEHGTDWLWTQLVPHPPQRTSVLFHPETYGDPVAKPPLDYATIVRGKTEHLTKNRDWSEINTVLGEVELRGNARYTDGTKLDAVMKHLQWAQKLDGMLPDRSAAIYLLDFDGAEAASEYLTLLEEERLEAVKDFSEAIGRPVTIEHESFEEVEADEGLLRVEKVLTDGGGLIQEKRFFYARRDDVVVVVRAEGFRPGLRAGRAVEAVFSDLEAAQ